MKNYRDELMQDQSFIRCSVLIAELLIKYRNQDAKDNENHKEPDMGSVTYHLLKQHSVILMLKKDIPHCPKWAVGSLHF